MSKNYNQISKEILEYVGGKENIVSAAHCATLSCYNMCSGYIASSLK